jgi:acyl-CoA thioesterase FadM
MATITMEHADGWLRKLKIAWEGGDAKGAVSLFSHTREYYERPFKAGTTKAEIEKYWEDIDGLRDITFDYRIAAIDGNLVVAHWQNGFVTPDDDKRWLLDGVFFIEFDDAGNCSTFRQWWFAAD